MQTHYKGLSSTPWQLACVSRVDYTNPEALSDLHLQWRDAVVPGTVQCSPFGIALDTLYQKANLDSLSWMDAAYWLYRTHFDMPELLPGQEAVYYFNGIDYKCHITINGYSCLTHEGMFSPVVVPLDGQAGKLELCVLLEPFADANDPHQTLKARYSMGGGWDCAPKLQARGIWDACGLLVREKLRVTGAWLDVRLDNQQRADVTVRVTFSEKIAAGEVVVELDGVTRSVPVFNTDSVTLPLHISSPTLWWPNGAGEPNLVLLRVDLKVPDRRTSPFTQRVGLRVLDRTACTSQKVEDTPWQWSVNHRKIFVKGVNWLPADACAGTVTMERYQRFLQQFRDAGVNCIRVWGGGLVEKDTFYQLADEYGFMVIQDFPLACQRLSHSEKFLRLLHQESTAIIQRLRHHPSLIAWTGGDELYQYFDSLATDPDPTADTPGWLAEHTPREWRLGANTYDEPALALLGERCRHLDGTRPFQLTSALEGEGDVHGIWSWNPAIGDPRFRSFPSLYDYWRQADAHFYSECAVSSIANRQTIDYVFKGNADMPDPADHVWQRHHAFAAAWDAHPDLWLDRPSTEALAGPLANLDDLILVNQWMQGEGGRFLVEELRRKAGQVAGFLWWGVNEPWPTLAGTSLIDYFGHPKLGWRMVTNAFKQTILSLRYPHCVQTNLKPELWISHDGAAPFAGRYEIEVNVAHSPHRDTYTGQIRCSENSSLHIRTLIPVHLTPGSCAHICCRLYADANLVHQNDYLFAAVNPSAPPLGPDTLRLIRHLYWEGGRGRL